MSFHPTPSRHRGVLRESDANVSWASFSTHRLPVLLTGTILLSIMVFNHQTFRSHLSPLDNAIIKTSSGSESSPPQSYRTNATTCASKPVDQMKESQSMTSQSGEDEVLLRWFNGLCDGTYIEMGALDGRLFSNSYVFNKEFGWKGLLIEPSPAQFALLEVNRPNEIARVNGAVCAEEREVHFVDNHQAVNGIWEFSAPSFRDHFWEGMTLESTTPIPCSPLKDIIAQKIGHSAYFDLFSLDVEGGELEVLHSIDFTKVGFGIIVTEDDSRNMRKDTAVRTLLESQGYKHFGLLSLNGAYYINEHFADIYKDVMYS